MPSLQTLYPNPPPLGQPQSIGHGISWLRLPLPFALDHINVWLIEEDEYYTLVDCGACLPSVEALWQTIAQQYFNHKPLGRIILTHAHPDHIGMAGPLSRQFNTQVWMSSAEYLAARCLCANLPGFDKASFVAFLASHGLQGDANAQATEEARGGLFARLVPSPPLHYKRLQHGDTITIAGHNWQCLAGYGHSPEHLSLICPSLNIMISGDMLLPKISTHVGVYSSEPEANPLHAFLQSVGTMALLPNTLQVLPAHGLPFVGVHERCAQLLKHHEQRLQALQQAIAAEGPLCAQQALKILFKRTMDGHDLHFAMGEAIAHLHYLWHKGELQRIQNNGIWYFS